MSACLSCGRDCRGQYCMARECRAAKQRADYRARNPERPPTTTCANCGQETTATGPTPERRYCSRRPCILARRRWVYHNRDADPDETRMEDRPCRMCGVKMPKRLWRESDSEHGRWCRKKACQHGREMFFVYLESGERAWKRSMPTIECETCGSKKGVRAGYFHIDFRGDKPALCNAVGDKPPDEFLRPWALEDWREEAAEHGMVIP